MVGVLTGALLFVRALVLSPDGAEEFAQGLSECDRLIERGSWLDAKAKIRALVEKHGDRDYVRIRRPEVLERMARCEFRRGHPEPDPKMLVSGELLSYSRSTGDVKIRYRKETLAGDFMTSSSPTGPPTYRHPIVFRGPYSLELQGGGETPLDLAVAVEGEEFFRVQNVPPSRIIRYDGKAAKLLVKEDPPKPTKDPHPRPRDSSQKVAVGTDEIVYSQSGRRVIAVKKPTGHYGSFAALCELKDFSQLVVEGKADPAWMKGLVDAAMTRAYAEFEKTYDPAADLPAWFLVKREEPSPAAGKPATPPPPPPIELPALATVSQRSAARRALEMLEKEKFADGLKYVQDLAPDAVAAPTRDFLLALFQEKLHDEGVALESCGRVIASDAKFLPARMLRASLLTSLRRFEPAMAEYRSLLAERPKEVAATQALVGLLLVCGRPEEAKAEVDRAIRADVPMPLLETLNAVLAKALNGPPWSHPQEYRSKHYEVRSDMDFKSCLEASKILEDGYFAYTYRLRPVPDAEEKRFRVYLFSSQAGYEAYAAGTGMAMRYTAGVYSPLLKQLLVWNQPDKKFMARTIRHEGFHQYLDRLMDYPPTWLNEGLAEYYELAGIVGDKWTEGQVNAGHLGALGGEGFPKVGLRDFLAMAPQDFYGKDASEHYAEAWALVHYLRQGGPQNQKVFDALFDLLSRKESNGEAMRQAFGPLDLAAFERGWREHVRRLR